MSPARPTFYTGKQKQVGRKVRSLASASDSVSSSAKEKRNNESPRLLKSAKSRHPDCQIVRRRGRIVRHLQRAILGSGSSGLIAHPPLMDNKALVARALSSLSSAHSGVAHLRYSVGLTLPAFGNTRVRNKS